MCIIHGQVESVAKTRILVAPCADGKRQLTVYCNKVTMKQEGGVMILPFPTSECRFVDLSAYPTLFKDLHAMMPIALGFNRKLKGESEGARPTLEVFDVGSYKASVVPAVADLERLDASTFHVDQTVCEFLSRNYPKGFSFVVCQLDVKKEYHPFGYQHGAMARSRLFVPTMHYHQQQQGDIHSDWDHDIYTWNSHVLRAPDAFKTNQAFQPERQAELIAAKIPCALEPCQSLRCYTIKNYDANHDLICRPDRNTFEELGLAC
jgi:hypothetical protein